MKIINASRLDAETRRALSAVAAVAGATLCTSTTRPVSPERGQIIIETNTGVLRVWTGSECFHFELHGVDLTLQSGCFLLSKLDF